MGSGTGQTSAGIVLTSPGAKVTLTNTALDGFGVGIQTWAGAVKPRKTTIGHAAVGVSFLGGSLDLGSVSDPGGNVFQMQDGTALNVNPPAGSGGVVIAAFGNTWIPNSQGADPNGHYVFGVATGPFGLSDPMPRNLVIAAGSKVVR